MKMILKIAWRNLWRNKRRTKIAVSSVFFAALTCLIMKSVMEGTTNYIIDTAVERQTGTFQVMGCEYWDDKTVDNFIEVDENTLNHWEAIPNVKRVTPRIETFAMAWNGVRSKPVNLMGIDPARESQFSKLNTRMQQGEFLSQDDEGIIVGSKYAEVMNLAVGDTLALVGQGYHGSSAVGLFVIKGIVMAFNPVQDAGCIYASLTATRNFIEMPDGQTYISVVLHNTNKIRETVAVFQQAAAGNDFVYRPWQELIEETAAGAASDKKSLQVFFYILYVVVGFGLLGTVIMLTNERRKEFGVMAALGMKKRSLIGGLFIEMFLVNLLGLLTSLAVAFPVILYFHYIPIRFTGALKGSMEDMGVEPILPFDLHARLFITQSVIVACIAVIITLYPYLKIKQMNIIDALRK
jgi:ABC-type lipoprotein release transport system permease subunit